MALTRRGPAAVALRSLNLRLAADSARKQIAVERDSRRPPSKHGPQERTVRDRITEECRRVAASETAVYGPDTLVAVWAFLHERVYGADPVPELVGKGWLGARSAASKLIRDEFDDNAVRALEFVRWCWRRESEREEWRREQNSKNGSRLSWQQQFRFRRLLVDWRTAVSRGTDRRATPKEPGE